MRMALSVLLTCWPPAPEERKVSICKSAGLISNSTSSTSGRTATVTVEVWMRPAASVSGTRWTRWTPLSYFRREYAPRALDDEADFLDAAQLRVVHVRDLALPAAGLGVHGVHAVEAAREQRGFLPADAGADLNDDVFPVVRVTGEHQEFYLLLQLLKAGLSSLQLLAGKLSHFGVRQQLLRVCNVGLALEVLTAGGGQGRELLLLLCQLGIGLGVGIVLRLGHFPLQLRVFCLNFP